MKIIIKFATYQVEATLLDTPTAHSIFKALPLEANINRWGEEIYFDIPVHTPLEPLAKAEVNEGDLAYWPNMPAFCIFFGPTPVSRGKAPRAASPVNVFGKLSALDREALDKIRDGENIRIEKVI
jgi:hypothetical protein